MSLINIINVYRRLPYNLTTVLVLWNTLTNAWAYLTANEMLQVTGIMCPSDEILDCDTIESILWSLKHHPLYRDEMQHIALSAMYLTDDEIKMMDYLWGKQLPIEAAPPIEQRTTLSTGGHIHTSVPKQHNSTADLSDIF